MHLTKERNSPLIKAPRCIHLSDPGTYTDLHGKRGQGGASKTFAAHQREIYTCASVCARACECACAYASGITPVHLTFALRPIAITSCLFFDRHLGKVGLLPVILTVSLPRDMCKSCHVHV